MGCWLRGCGCGVGYARACEVLSTQPLFTSTRAFENVFPSAVPDTLLSSAATVALVPTVPSLATLVESCLGRSSVRSRFGKSV